MTRTARLTAAWLPLVSAGIVLAQFPQPQPPAAPDGIEVLARGPVHEAFAGTAELPAAGPVILKAPPDPVEELPPDQKPPGDDVQWMPGYWQWDEERADFIWISGFWRQPPPGRVWVPGAWRQAPGGFQWVQGFWNGIAPQQPQQLQQPAQIEYLPPPPVPLELAPSVPAPTATCFYVPGVWQWHARRFAWRPGYWVEHRPNWVWVPSHYRWTPAGCVFIDGYWDRPLADRGLLFAPVAFRPAVLVRPRFVYTPAYVVTDTSLYGSLFVRHGFSNYYFGDYYERRYVNAGYSAWCGVSLNVGRFAVSVGRPAPVYDPLWDYYSLTFRNDPRWQASVTGLYTGRYNGDFARPLRTLAQQNTVVKNITNVTNVNTVNNNVMVTKLTEVRPATRAAALQVVSQADRVREQQNARELRQLATQRQKLETGLVDRGRTVAKLTDQPQAVKLDLPKTATIRAQVPAAKAPPELPKPVNSRPNPPRTIPPANPQPAPPTLPKQGRPQPIPMPPKPPGSQPPFVPAPKPPRPTPLPTTNPPMPVPQPAPRQDRPRPPKPPVSQPPTVPPPTPFLQPKPPVPQPPMATPRPQPPTPKPPAPQPPMARPQPPAPPPPAPQVQPKPLIPPAPPTAPRPAPKPRPKDKEKDKK